MKLLKKANEILEEIENPSKFRLKAVGFRLKA